jgi:hypothetical protein
MRHVRDALTHYIESKDENERVLLNAFLHYGVSQLESVLVDLDRLYRECTGKELQRARVR